MVQIIWVKRAIQDLNEIAGYIAKDSPRYADLTIEKIFDKTQILKEYPEIGRVVPEINDTRIRELIEGRYRIIYEINNPEQIEILTVHHSSKLLKS
ncbi:MAG: type II toxin-antitoxin system RelE/ParE family toxin [Cytophagaceae bacterium]